MKKYILSILLISMAVGFFIGALNLPEELKKRKEKDLEKFAGGLLSINLSQLEGVVESGECEEIVGTKPFGNISHLKSQLPDTFIKKFEKQKAELYLGIVGDKAKICYRVDSVRNRTIVQNSKVGCVILDVTYLCLPR